MAGRFSVEAVFRAKDRITGPVSRMQRRIGKFTQSTERGFRRLDKSAGNFAKKMKTGAAVFVAATTIMAAAFLPVLAAGADFEQAITNVGAVSLQTRADIAPLEQMALQLGKTTKFTATQAANAMEILSRAGFRSNEILQATPAILSAAAASGLEIAEVADHVSNALKGMGLETSEAARVSDVLALASSRTNSTIGTLGESIRNVAATARQLNIPFEEVAASVALLQDVGLDASVAGSAFNTMLTKMAAPTDGMKKKMRRLGISFKDAKGNMLPFQKVIGQLNKASKRIGGNFDQVAFLAELVGLRGQKAAANLGMLFETGKLKKLTKELENAAGSAKKMADIRMNTVQGSMLLLGSAVDAVKVKIFSMNEGPLKGVVDRTTAWVGANEGLIASKIGGFLAMLIDNMGNIITWAKRVGVAFGVFVIVTSVIRTLSAAMVILNGLMIMNPVGLIAIGFFLLAAAVALVITNFGKLKKGFSSLPAWAQTAIVTSMAVPGLLLAAPAGLAALAGSAFSDDPQTVTPQERTARSIEEKRTTSTAEVILRAGAGTSAEIANGPLGMGLKLEETGAF